MGASTGRVTSHDVAAEAGVSQATVARVFASPDKVAEATQAKVHAAADRLGYTPNAIARSLKAQRTDIVGAVVPATGEYWQHVLTAFSRQLTAQGRQLLLFSFDEADQVEAVLETVARYRLDGLIAASASISNAQLARLEQSEMPLVAFNQPAAIGLMPVVTVDNEAGAATVADHMVDQGARSAMFVGGIASASTDRLRYRGATVALSARGVACRYLEAGAFSYEAGYKIASTLADEPLPDALIVAADELAFGVIDGLRARGIEAPRDVLIAGFDGLPQAAWAGYDLTTLEQPTELLVESAIHQIVHTTTSPVDATADAAADVTRPSGGRDSGDSTGSSYSTDVVVPGSLRQGRTTDNA